MSRLFGLFSILHDFKGRSFLDFFQNVEAYDEYTYMTLFLRRFGPAEFHRWSAIGRLLPALRAPAVKPLSLAMLQGLEKAKRKFLDHQVAPDLVARGLNLVGFTLSYHQVYSSLYAAEHLRRRFPNRHFLFVYAAASLPTVYNLLTNLGLPGIIVVGEGENNSRTSAPAPRPRPTPARGGPPSTRAPSAPGATRRATAAHRTP